MRVGRTRTRIASDNWLLVKAGCKVSRDIYLLASL